MVVIQQEAAKALSTTETANLMAGADYEFLNRPGLIKLVATGSAQTVKITAFSIGGSNLVEPGTIIPFLQTAGAIDSQRHVVLDWQKIGTGRVKFKVVATTGTPTMDYQIHWMPL